VAQTGLSKVIAVTNKARSPAMPEAPTVMEVRFPDLSYEAFLGFNRKESALVPWPTKS
jgi:hypothetical protein